MDDPNVTTPVFPELQTTRLRLREITMDDADWFLSHFSTPEIVHGQGFPAPDGIEGAREELARYVVDLFAQQEGLRWGICLRGDDALIGSAGLYDWDREVGSAELGYDLAPEHWGAGIMTEALRAILDYGFTTMGLNRVQVLVMPRNARSLRTSPSGSASCARASCATTAWTRPAACATTWSCRSCAGSGEAPPCDRLAPWTSAASTTSPSTSSAASTS